MGTNEELLKPLHTWATDEEDLSLGLHERDEYHITDKGNLRAVGYYSDLEDEQRRWEPGEKVIHSFYLPSLAHYHTTDYLRWACEELHPEIDFDEEFKTGEPGVFARYEERFGRDYDDIVCQMKLENLKQIIKELGYELKFGEKGE